MTYVTIQIQYNTIQYFSQLCVCMYCICMYVLLLLNSERVLSKIIEAQWTVLLHGLRTDGDCV